MYGTKMALKCESSIFLFISTMIQLAVGLDPNYCATIPVGPIKMGLEEKLHWVGILD